MNARAIFSLLIAGIAGGFSAFGQEQVARNVEINPRQTNAKTSLTKFEHLMPPKKAGLPKFTHESFTFVRIKYNTSADRMRRAAWWIDYPDSDQNLSIRFGEATGMKMDPEGKVMELTDPSLKNYPFIYIVEGGAILLNDREVQGLRDYLNGGGFLMVDDFWGEKEWESLREQIKRVFPNREVVDLPVEHAVFNCYYQLLEKPQVPNVRTGINSQYTGRTWEQEDGKHPHYRGLVGDNGKLMAVFCHNTDLGDGWEREEEDQYYFREFSLKKAYPMGINIVVYALTK
jgi:hypothetical protein